MNYRKMAYQKCKAAGLDDEKTINLLSTVEHESGFNPLAEHRNSDKRQTIDCGIAQLNTYWYLSQYSMSCQEAKMNPEKCLDIMISAWKRGRARDWVAYSSGAYKKHLPYVREYVEKFKLLKVA